MARKYTSSSNRSKGTVVSKKTGKHKFPVGDKGQARAAMSRLNQAKPPLSTAGKKHVAREAKRVLGHSTAAIKRILAL